MSLQLLNSKRERGIYYTERNVFNLKPFKDWFEKNLLVRNTVLEPFAGNNNLIKLLKEIYPVKSVSYDINSKTKDIIRKDTLKDFPSGFKVCISNPPCFQTVQQKEEKLISKNKI